MPGHRVRPQRATGSEFPLRAGAAALCVALAGAAPAYGDDPAPAQDWAIHAQATYVEQEASSFPAPYRGANSLTPARGRETTDATLYLGRRLWHGAELWINPEIDQGFGLDDTLGVAGFPSGEAYKVGRNNPYFRLQRAFIRDTIDMGGDVATVEAAPNWLAGTHTGDRWVVTFGKFSVGDVFDVNQYAHDPRGDFLNWSVIDGGAFDYAADAWGYTAGIAVEWYRGSWTLRAGALDLSTVPNSEHLQSGLHQFQWIGEIERRYELGSTHGKLLLTGFQSRGRMALLRDAIEQMGVTGAPADLGSLRRYRSREGVTLNLEQALSDELGLFARVSGAGGNVEAYEFTDVDRSALIGASLKGVRWARAHDTVGLAAAENRSSAIRQQYLAVGGLGILVGDGRLPHPGAERIIETYYCAAATDRAQITLDYQRVANPAYNRDRGPASIYAVRVHLQF